MGNHLYKLKILAFNSKIFYLYFAQSGTDVPMLDDTNLPAQNIILVILNYSYYVKKRNIFKGDQRRLSFHGR